EGGLIEEERGDEPEGQERADAPAGVGDVPGAIAILDEELDVEPVLPGLLEERLELVELALLAVVLLLQGGDPVAGFVRVLGVLLRFVELLLLGLEYLGEALYAGA